MTNANGHGGRREGAGRKSDAQKMLYAIPSALELLGHGITPVEQMLLQMRKAWERVLVQQEIIDAKIGKGEKPDQTDYKDLANLESAAFSFAEKCAPYIHPRLTAAKIEGGDSSLPNGGLVVQAQKYDDKL